MSSIDQRVVQMQFDNTAFEKGITTTLSSLDKLNSSLKMQGATKGLTDVEAAAKGMNLSSISSGVDAIASKFSTMGAIGLEAIQHLTDKVLDFGIELAKSFVLDPIKEGFENYETHMNAIQTILANTARLGTTLPQVTAAMNELQKYTNLTVYNFSDMAQNVSRFTADGANLNESVSAVKGIANLAAMSGSSSAQASEAMYELSEAIASGSVNLQKWNTVVNAGMGGKVFQTALENTAKAAGVNIDAIIKKAGSFRQSLQKGWLTSSIMLKTLDQFTGDLSEKQIEAMGFTQQQSQAIMNQARIAVSAATNVKTFTQLTTSLKEEVASAYGSIFYTLIGNLTQATSLFTTIHNIARPALTDPIYALNNLLEDWDALGGRTVLIQALGDAFHILGTIMSTLKGAWQEVFPPTSGKDLMAITVAFKDFVDSFKMGGAEATELKNTFAGVFAVLKIGVDIVIAIGKALFGLVGSAAQGSGGILKITSAIGQWLVSLKDAIEKGGILNTIFGDLAKVLVIPIKLVTDLTGYLGDLFSKFNDNKATKSISDMSEKLTPFAEAGKIADEAWSFLLNHLSDIANFFGPLGAKFDAFFKGISASIMHGLSSLNFQDVLNTFNTGLFAGLVLLVKKVVDKFTGDDESNNPISGFFDTIKEAFEGLTETLEGMQKALKAAMLLEIAAAVGVLTVSILVLSRINATGLERATAAITAMFAQLMGSLMIFEKFVEGEGWAKMPVMMGSLILLAAAVDVLVIAVKQLADMSWEQLGRGMSGLTAIIGELLAVTKLMDPEGMTVGGLAMIALAHGVGIITDSVTKLGGMSWEALGKGLTGVAGILTSLTLFSRFFEANATGILAGAGIILLAEGIKILADAMGKFVTYSWDGIAKGLVTLGGSLAAIGMALKLIPPSSILSAAAVLIVASSLGMIGDSLVKMGSMSWDSVAKGLVSLGVGLGLIAAALALLPPSSVMSAAAILVVAASLSLITDALVKMGGQSWDSIAKGLVELAGSLAIIAAAMAVMVEALPGAAALMVVAVALKLLVPVMQAFGSMSWGDIAKSLVALAGVFVVLGLAGLALGAVTPVLIGLGVAITLLGVGVLAAGAGVLLFSMALTALAASGAAGAAALVAIVTAMLGLLPTVAKEIGLAVIAFAQTIAEAGPAITKAIVTVLSALISAIVQLAPQVVDALLKLLTMLVDELNKYVPHLVSAAINLVLAILNGINQKLGAVITAGGNLVVTFLNGISAQIPKVIQAGVNLILNFINSVANAIRGDSTALGQAGGNLASAIIEGMMNGLAGGIGEITSQAANIGKAAINAARSVLQINSPSKAFIAIGQSVNEGFLKGLTSGNAKDVDNAFQGLRNQLTNTVNSNNSQIDALQKRLQTLESARKKNYTAISQVRSEISQLTTERAKEQAALNLTNTGLTKQHTLLDQLDTKYQSVTSSLKTAETALANAIKTRDDYNTKITQQYDAAPAFTSSTTIEAYDASLQDQIQKTQDFANTLQSLRKLGLSDAAYQELLSEGIGALPIAQQLLAQGKTGVNQINALDAQLQTVSANLGKTASTDLYQAAVNSAQGLVDGLQKQQAALEKEMETLADAMVNAIKKKLGIHSPSTVFAEVGGFSAAGLAQGLVNMSGIVEDSATAVGTNAVTAMQKSLANLSTMVTDNMQIQPTITPVLDLSGVKKTASQIGTMLASQPLSVQASYLKAQNASAGYMANQSAADNTPTNVKPPQAVTFNQYNSSPVALSPADIYRQTKNQLSTARGYLVYQNGGNQP